MIRSIFYYFLLLSQLYFLSFSFICGHNEYSNKKPIISDEKPLNMRVLQSGHFEAIRIYYDYNTLDNQNSVSLAFRNNIKQILSLSKSSFESLLMVRRFRNKMTIPICNNDALNISSKVQQGIEADLVIFPYVDTNYTGTLYEAYASPCILSSDTKRPVAGYIAFTQILKISNKNWLLYYTILAMHELSHVLVFSPNLFPFYIDENGKNIPMNKIIKKTIVNGLERTLIITPTVLKKAKKHFNCSDIEGVELENQGNAGTAGSHWEGRIMLTDYMIGASYDEMTLSEITLGLFEDSGWYKVNYYTGGLFRFGKNEGCSFLNSTCVTNSRSNFPNEYCDQKYSPQCTNGRLSKGICYYSEYNENLNSAYQYFLTSRRTGGLLLADYCPVSQVPPDNTTLLNWGCSNGLSSYPADLGEVISAESICFISSLISQNSMLNTYFRNKRAICHKYQCDYANNVLYVIINEKKIKCNSAIGTTKVDGYYGEIECPQFNNVCTSNISCSDFVDCIQKKSIVNDKTFIDISQDKSTHILLNNTIHHRDNGNESINQSLSIEP